MHVGTRRVQTVTANVSGGDTRRRHHARSRTALRRRPASPPAIYAEIGGTGTAQREARRELLLNSLLAGAGIVMLLWLAFGESSRLALVLANLPFALVGGVLAVFATGGLLSLGSLVGFVTLFGIATRNAVMLVSHYDHLVRAEGVRLGIGSRDPRRHRAARPHPHDRPRHRAWGCSRWRIGSGDPGREIEGPMAIVILGGLATSTVLTLFVLPTLALRFGRFAERRELDAEEALT